MAKEYIRRAHHAGSWYEDDPKILSEMLQGFLNATEHSPPTNNTSTSSDSTGTSANVNAATSTADGPSNNTGGGTEIGGFPRGVIAPHAGYSYSGPTAAYAYANLREALMRGWSGTVVVLHPSHHVYLDGCAVSGASVIETPIHDIPVDNALRLELIQTGQFSTMSRKTDEMEHSGEMQYPFIAQIYTEIKSKNEHMNIPPIQILPIMIGATSQSKYFGHLLAPILSRPDIFTVISTDFCHWGSRFGYSPTDAADQTQSFTEIHEFIEWLDREGMEKISLQDPGAFAKYMKKYRNTICGRYPISVYLNALEKGKESGLEEVNLEFVRYAQSSRVKSVRESCVSYASAVARKI